MPVEDLKNHASLSDPKPQTGPLLPAMSGRAKTVKPLTERAYAQIKSAFEAQDRRMRGRESFRTSQGTQPTEPKLGFLLERAKIPRVLAQKMADLTESYCQQMKNLIKTAEDLAHKGEVAVAPELGGRFEKSRDTAQRFQDAMQGIEGVFERLRRDSREAVREALSVIDKLSTDDEIRSDLERSLLKKYQIDSNFGENPAAHERLEPKPTLLPLIKGPDVYESKRNALGFLLSSRNQTNQSMKREDQARTAGGTLIQVLDQVQPKHNTSVFSDHAGFIAKFSRQSNDSPPLYVYYHSLEHGHQHTDTRTALEFGSLHSFAVPLESEGTFDPLNPETVSVHDPRSAYVDQLRDGLFDVLASKARNEGANLILIVGECTRSIHKQLLHLIFQFTLDASNRLPETQVAIPGTATQNLDFKLDVINASKPNEVGAGLGVHALVAYVFSNTQLKMESGFELKPCMLTLKNSWTRQNILSLTYGPKLERHAFAHLLNGEEDALANELSKCGYVSVGGDLNNIKVGTDLVQTVNHTSTQMSMGSNSTSNVMYDKITLLNKGGERKRKRDED